VQRRQGLAPDELTEASQAVLTEAKRATIHHILARHGVSRQPRKEEQETGQDDKAVYLALGIEHRPTQSHTPKTNGMVKRMNGLTKEAATKVHRYETASQLLDDLHVWFVRYNFCRKHRRLGGKTPNEACLAWFSKQQELFIKEPTALLAYRS
jgi:transposase InsO family protein